MKAIIQHNFTSGLGDFIADVSHYLTILDEIKNKGYEIHLRISLRGNKYTNGSFFSELFDEETVNFFDSIIETNENVSGLEIDGCKYHSSNHHPQSPGYHHFDVFFDKVPENFGCLGFDAQRAYSNNHFPKILPKLSKNVENKINSFWSSLPEDYNFLHIRTSDIIDSDKLRYDRIIDNVKKHIDETDDKFHLGTNNRYIYNQLKDYKNIFVYNFQNYELVDNDMNAFTNGWSNKNLTTEVLNERLIDICAELASIQKSSKIFFCHDVSWISNFLFYSICVTQNKIELINKNLWLN